MRILEIQPLDNGAHRNQTIDFNFLPDGWAVIPEEIETPNFPFGEIEVEEIDGVQTVTKWIAGEIPEPEPIPEPEVGVTADAILNVILGVSE
jgi:hypothetical protein